MRACSQSRSCGGDRAAAAKASAQRLISSDRVASARPPRLGSRGTGDGGVDFCGGAGDDDGEDACGAFAPAAPAVPAVAAGAAEPVLGWPSGFGVEAVASSPVISPVVTGEVTGEVTGAASAFGADGAGDFDLAPPRGVSAAAMSCSFRWAGFSSASGEPGLSSFDEEA